MTNSNKLKGRIIEKGYTLSSFAAAVHLSRPCLRKRISGQSVFKASEIETICNLLDIPHAEMCKYFFCRECPQNRNKDIRRTNETNN